ncbi:hypothetical protein NW762_004597 [Fusarium torreyae]|uniref:Uncharacterized protein n=1 Tax=Fusarium torreyae TaxID=1237075 RepID=A0A9W8VH09_9HYPO|nr:hypothetical protein NW762_004597 [Fusarium torreyae]
MDKHKNFLQKIADENSSLIAEINQLSALTQTRPQEEVNAATRQCLLRLFEAIALITQHLGHPRTPRAKVLSAWESFLPPIKALALLPFGDFLTARMLLYLGSGLSAQRALDMKFPRARAYSLDVPLNQFNIELDDALLEFLQRMWTKSDSCEEFEWIFSGYDVSHSRKEERFSEEVQRCHKIVQALTPVELVALGGIQGRRFIFAKKNDVEYDPDEGIWQPFMGSIPGDHYERMWSSVHIPDDDELESAEWVYKMVGTDGPIRDAIHYFIEESGGEESRWNGLDLFPRSLQFVLDARRVGQPILALKRRVLADKTLLKAGIPTELRTQILSHLNVPVRHPYLSSLNIVEAYARFPKRDGPSCPRCSGGSASKKETLTCPTKSMYIWNRPLRTFFVFHGSKATTTWLCKYGTECEGHHDDNEWKISRERDLNAYIEDVVKDRCGSTTALSEVGFAPATDYTLNSDEEDRKRRARLYNGYGPLEDSSNELKMNGGLFGLASSMVHGKILIGSWQGADSGGHSTTDAEWAVARCPADQERAKRAIKRMHSRCDRC